MKKETFLAIVFIFGLASFSNAQSGQVVTVQKVMEMPNESFVVLEGFIIKSLGDEHYMFQDKTGKIEAEIDNDLWQGQRVDSKTKVRIQGKFDKEFTSKSIDVEKVIIISDSST